MKTIDASYTPSLPSSLLLIGGPGTGKSTLAMQFPKPFFLDCDNNLDGPIRHLQQTKQLPPQVYFDTPRKNEKGEDLHRGDMYERASVLLKEACESPDVETVVIDSLTTLSQIILDFVRKTQKRGFGDGIKTADPVLQIQDWGIFLAQIQQLILWLKSSNKIIIFIAHYAVEKDELTQSLNKMLNVPGRIQTQLSGYFQEAWECFVEVKGVGPTAKAERMIRTVPTPKEAMLGLKTSVGLAPTEPINMANFIKKFKPQ